MNTQVKPVYHVGLYCDKVSKIKEVKIFNAQRFIYPGSGYFSDKKDAIKSVVKTVEDDFLKAHRQLQKVKKIGKIDIGYYVRRANCFAEMLALVHT
jgi:hypothetical protein